MAISYKDISPKYKQGNLVGYNEVNDLVAIENSILNLFTIELGEVPGKPWLGNPISLYIFDNIGFFEERAIETALRNVLEKYEPRVQLISIKINVQDEYNYINITLDYIVFINSNEIFQNTSFSLAHNSMTSIQTRTGTTTFN